MLRIVIDMVVIYLVSSFISRHFNWDFGSIFLGCCGLLVLSKIGSYIKPSETKEKPAKSNDVDVRTDIFRRIQSDKDIVVFDCETTGLNYDDKMVSLGAVKLNPDLSYKESMYYEFNPEKPCHPNAYDKHGFSDRYLRKKPKFSHYASNIYEFFQETIPVAHYAEFDFRFMKQEFSEIGRNCPISLEECYCTFKEWKRTFPRRSGKLDNVLKHIGLERLGPDHDGFEDAVLTANLLRHYHGLNKPLRLRRP